MGGGGGGGGGGNAYLGQGQHWLNQAANLAQQNYGFGQNWATGYGGYMGDLLKSMWQGAQGGVSPVYSQLLQPVLQQTYSGIDAMKRRILGQQNFGPGQQERTMQDMYNQAIASAQGGGYNILSGAIPQVLGMGQTGAQMMSQAPQTIAGVGQAFGNIGINYEQMKMAAQQQGNQGLAQGLAGIGTLVGMIGMAPMTGGGSLFGMLGSSALGALGGGAAGAGADALAGSVANQWAQTQAGLPGWMGPAPY